MFEIIKSDENGVALLAAVVIIFLLVTLVAVFLVLVNTKTTDYYNQLEYEKAISIAESGIADALWYLNNVSDTYTPPPGNSVFFDSGYYEITITHDIGDSKQIICYAYIPDTDNYRIKKGIKIYGDLLNNNASPIYDYALFSDTTITVDWSAARVFIYNGSLHSNHKVIFSNGDTKAVALRVSSVDTVSVINWTGLPYDSVAAYVNYVDTPIMDDTALQYYEDSAVIKYYGDSTITGVLTQDGIYFIGGNVNINCTIAAQCVIVSTSTITVTGNIRYQKPSRDSLGLVSFNDVIYNTDTDVFIDAAIYADSSFIINVQDTVTIFGNLAVKDVILLQPGAVLKIYYDRKLFSFSRNPAAYPEPDVFKITWVEIF
ncbi:MAG: hypothetical protein AB1765_04155 [Candidatus Hydrogenedentota bacterium]